MLRFCRITCQRLMLLALLLAVPYEAVWSTDSGQQATSPTKIQGTIVDLQPDCVVVKTSTGKYRVKRKTIPLNAAPGDPVTLWVTAGHAVVDHHRQDTGRRHRFVTGTLLDTPSKQQIHLWTPEAEKVYSLAEHEAKATQLPEGTMVTVEIDETGTVLDLHPVETEVAACDKRHHCKVMLHGTVRKIEDGMIFIETPVVEYEVPIYIAPRSIAPGDEMTLWVNENDVVLNYHQAGDQPHRRFVTGPLRYTDKARSHVQLWTPEGKKTFSLVHLTKAGDLVEGHPVTLEVGEGGVVLDCWQSS
ncbi:MAG: hypothetical protein NW701_14790 [Nitrospira sp.]